MKISINQLKRLIRETIEEMSWRKSYRTNESKSHDDYYQNVVLKGKLPRMTSYANMASGADRAVGPSGTWNKRFPVRDL